MTDSSPSTESFDVNKLASRIDSPAIPVLTLNERIRSMNKLGGSIPVNMRALSIGLARYDWDRCKRALENMEGTARLIDEFVIVAAGEILAMVPESYSEPETRTVLQYDDGSTNWKDVPEGGIG